MKKNEQYKKINLAFMVFYLLVCVWGMIDSFLNSTPYYMGLSLLSLMRENVHLVDPCVQGDWISIDIILQIKLLS